MVCPSVHTFSFHLRLFMTIEFIDSSRRLRDALQRLHLRALSRRITHFTCIQVNIRNAFRLLGDKLISNVQQHFAYWRQYNRFPDGGLGCDAIPRWESISANSCRVSRYEPLNPALPVLQTELTNRL